ncbi:n-acetylglutamate synthase [Galbibacter pacificus]|uniref:N-acetylglutamate synthase n=1 Tax=Galbibacter pacificus TaxID=2996052 RepID=A0ABT6FM09_9FLAO|nr:n-acetylglutamate synthase [Galbibacter pacificus]MDG3580807.1 n-acetylglutamate synthase [Galbibacter pacificus]MDG3584285.1 n-acetylglutamate synthase [Galbibacter pacificus]
MNKIDYNGKSFKAVSNTGNGETSNETIFTYVQQGNILTASYAGGNIVSGHLIGMVNENGEIDMRYHQINNKGILQTGTCNSEPEILKDGRIRLHEKWKWTSGDESSGISIIEEII